MITESQYMNNGKYMGAVTLYGLSTDSKPDSVGNGSCFVEMDTGTISFFDAESSNWVEFEGTGVSLPVVTPDDNGDVLTVVNGAWAKAAPSGGGALIAHMDDATGALDKTWQEIYEANFAVLAFNGEASILCATCVEITQSGYGINFYLPPHTGGAGELLPFAASSADEYPVYVGD